MNAKDHAIMSQWFGAISVIMFFLLVIGISSPDIRLIAIGLSWLSFHLFIELRIAYLNKKAHQTYIKRLQASDMASVDQMTGRQFELYLEVLFIGLGYQVEQLPTSTDYGADLILVLGETRIAVQAKRYKANVGNRAVQMILGAKKYYGCDEAWIITNSFYTKAAIQMASKTEVRLYDRNGLLEFMTMNKALLK